MRCLPSCVASLLLAFALLCVACGAPAKPTSKPSDTHIAATDDRGVITGDIVDSESGARLPMVTVQVERDGQVVVTDVSDAQGRYRLGPLPPGHYRVTARQGDRRIVYEGIEVVAGESRDVDVSIDARGSVSGGTEQNGGDFGVIEGVVLDEGGTQSFPGAVVSLESDLLSDALQAMADEDGAFHFRGLAPGRYRLSCYYYLVEHGSIELRRGPIEVHAGETTKVRLEMDMRLR